jgi:hypothetical protein
MKKLSMARRRAVLMASGMSMFAAVAGSLGPALARSTHLPVRNVVLSLVTLEVVAFAFVVKSLVHLKQDEARERLHDGRV